VDGSQRTSDERQLHINETNRVADVRHQEPTSLQQSDTSVAIGDVVQNAQGRGPLDVRLAEVKALHGAVRAVEVARCIKCRMFRSFCDISLAAS
jgi:hypothetical protein